MQIRSAEFVVGAVGKHDRPDDGLPEVAFSGRSNVGKSSLINRLVQRKSLARTSSTPGKTQQLNYYRVNEALYLVDLPGYGYVRGGAELRARVGRLAKDYLESSRQLRAIIQLIDVRHGPTELDMTMIDWLRERSTPFLLVFTKVDKLSRAKLKRQMESMSAEGRLAELAFATFSAVTGEGKGEIWGWLNESTAGDGE